MRLLVYLSVTAPFPFLSLFNAGPEVSKLGLVIIPGLAKGHEELWGQEAAS